MRRPGEEGFNLAGTLKCFLGDGDSAVLEFTEGAEGFELGVALVPSGHRGKGVGTLLLERLLILADSLGKPVHTQARPIGSSTSETLARLVRYYESWGFETRQRGVTSVMMVRPPRPLQRS